MSTPITPTSITLALQGGGAHGAFAWGAADQLLLDSRVKIDAITATSGGAMTAVVLADGLLRGGAEEARAHLQAFWRKVSIAAGMLPFRTGVMDKMLGSIGVDMSPTTVALDYITRIFSPYQFNLLDLNPLRGIVEEMVDFEALRAQKRLKLFINTTAVKTGQSRVFTEADVTLDAVMAAACLPFLFKTVNIDGEPYWDGGYSANPALAALVGTNAPRQVLLVESVPAAADDVPTRAPDILDRATEISFAQAFAAQLAAVEGKGLSLHRVEAGELIANLGRASKLNAEWDFLVYLHDLGAQAAADWLEAHAEELGKKANAA